MATAPLTSFQEIQEEWEGVLSLSPVDTLFLTPQWQEVWWDTFGNGKKLAGFYLRAAEGLMAVAPLARCGDTLALLGNQATVDYNDFVVRPGYEVPFFGTLLDLLQECCKALKLYSIAENSPTLTYLPDLARQRGYSVEVEQEDVAPGIALPHSWEEYLAGLSKKDRHELRRKLRRLDSLPNWRCYSLTDETQVSERLDDFIRLMRLSDADKDQYMTPEREQFFHDVAQRMARLGLVRLFFLESEGEPIATSLCFDYGPSRLLYNSGYNPEYGYYSVGLLLNALCLQDAIQQGIGYFDFLRGPEPYKYHLGGKDRIIYQMVVKRS